MPRTRNYSIDIARFVNPERIDQIVDPFVVREQLAVMLLQHGQLPVGCPRIAVAKRGLEGRE
jgi:hypothetical protein